MVGVARDGFARSSSASRTVTSSLASRRRQDGFTLVEIMVVMAIVVLLFGLVAVSMSQFLGRASKSATQAVVLKLEQYLDEYKGLTGHFPPDGIDSPVRTESGESIKGSACLYYFLSRPVVTMKTMGGRQIPQEFPPIAQFKESELTPEDPDNPDVREIIDGWATPIHYDNTEDGVFRPQRGEVHVPPLDDDEHPLDPREAEAEVEGQPIVPRSGIQNQGFDLWSHGEQGHDMEAPRSMPIASWNKEE